MTGANHHCILHMSVVSLIDIGVFVVTESVQHFGGGIRIFFGSVRWRADRFVGHHVFLWRTHSQRVGHWRSDIVRAFARSVLVMMRQCLVRLHLIELEIDVVLVIGSVYVVVDVGVRVDMLLLLVVAASIVMRFDVIVAVVGQHVDADLLRVHCVDCHARFALPRLLLVCRQIVLFWRGDERFGVSTSTKCVVVMNVMLVVLLRLIWQQFHADFGH
mmetsp:Transcript_16970/g.27043  ORF Transcript_16970/g.27043 Transcript_16970/m.27043 type:complete len:216 (-) Transcript_16970:305-952(-)